MRHLGSVLCAVLLSLTVLAREGQIVPGGNLVVEGIPKILPSLAEAAGRYTEFRSASLQSWHPSERQMLISTRFGDTNQVHLVRFPGGARTQLTFFPDRVSAARFSPRRSDYFVFSKDAGGGEWFQTYRYDLSSGAVQLLTDGGRSQNSLGRWSRNGDRLAYTSTRRNGKDRDLFVMNPAEPGSDREVARLEGGGWGVLDWSANDRDILLGEYLSINESYLWQLEASTGQKSLITPKGGPLKVAYSGAEYSKDGKGLFVSTDGDSEFQRLAYIDLASRQHTYLTSHIPWDVDEFTLSPDGKTIAFQTNEDGAAVLHLLDTQTRKEKSVPRLPLGELAGIRWHENGKDLGFNLISARSPADAYSLNVDTGKVERWTYSETGGLNTESFSEPELIHWTSFDGRRISGFLYRPPAKFTGKRPVVVSIHGGPEGQFRPGFMGRNNYFLNELGVTLIFPNVRGSSGYGKTFLLLDNGFKREDSYKDINALFDWIQTRSDLDASRVMVTGGSYGGFMTLAVASNYAARIRCALDVVGVSNFVTFLRNTEAYRQDLRRAEYGDERDPQMKEFLERIAPLNNAHKITKPLFVVQGANDPRVPRTESEQIAAMVRKNGTPVWYLMADDEGHGFVKKKNADFQFLASVLFVQEHLLK